MSKCKGPIVQSFLPHPNPNPNPNSSVSGLSVLACPLTDK